MENIVFNNTRIILSFSINLLTVMWEEGKCLRREVLSSNWNLPLILPFHFTPPRILYMHVWLEKGKHAVIAFPVSSNG